MMVITFLPFTTLVVLSHIVLVDSFHNSLSSVSLKRRHVSINTINTPLTTKLHENLLDIPDIDDISTIDGAIDDISDAYAIEELIDRAKHFAKDNNRPWGVLHCE